LLPVRREVKVLEKSARVGRVTVQYKVVLPTGYDATKAYPGIIALGGGPQTMNTVDGVLNRNFRAEAEKRGYIVIAPAAPDGQLFFEDGARIFPEFLKLVLADYKIQDGKFHIAGPSNGGIAAFHVAAANPQYFLSVTAFPGTCGSRARRSFKRSRRCVSSCTSVKTMSTDGTRR
jgi:dipeptidyl aminopeptidase/acylaminoacyl peptidase